MLDLGGALEKIHAMATVINHEAPWDTVELPFLTLGTTSRDADAMSTATWIDLKTTTLLAVKMSFRGQKAGLSLRPF